MFHQGDLQSGIATAIREQKVVACFIRADDDYWSGVWEDYWLSNNSHPTDMISDDEPPLGLIIADKAVLLKMDFGSKEAGFLAAFVKVEKAPTMVVVKDGKVLEKMEGGIGREEFVERLMQAVGLGGASAKDTEVLFNLDNDGEEVSETEEKQEGGNTDVVTESGQAEATQSSAQVQSMLAERGQRLEAERIKREAAEKAERTARANARRKEVEDAEAAQASKDRQRTTTERSEKEKARDAWIYQQKQRKDEAKQEKQRILAQIENDKQKRKAQAQRKKEVEAETGGGAFSNMPPSSSVKPPSAGAGQWCNLQVRLFDGSSLRGRFASDADITTAVRTWVQEASPAGGADIPYNFRQILTPLPNKTIEVAEEGNTLLDLGLVPSATLVLVPVAGATEAYSAAGRGYMSSALHAAYWAANTAYGFVGSFLSFVPGLAGAGSGLYMGGTADEQDQSNVQGARMADSDSLSQSTGGIRVKTLADQRKEAQKAQQGAEFYNGNSSAFQGRKDDLDE